jgi:hypothetical protein
MSNRLKGSILEAFRKLLLLWRMRRESAAFYRKHGRVVRVEPNTPEARKGGRSC